MSLYRKTLKFLYQRLRKDSGFLPARMVEVPDTCYVHESVELNQTQLMGYNSISPNVICYGQVEVGLYTTIGRNSIIHGGKIKIGNYCQLGPYSNIYGLDHPYHHLTIYNGKKLFNGRLKEFSKYHPVDIGHSVWIGHGASILKGVVIGNGAVIGANTVVTRDLPPYSIAVGSPAKVVGSRFSPELVHAIEETNWWNYTSDELHKFESLFKRDLSKDPQEAISHLQRLTAELCGNNLRQ